MRACGRRKPTPHAPWFPHRCPTVHGRRHDVKWGGQWSGQPFGPLCPAVPLNPVSQSIFELYPNAQSPADCPNVSNSTSSRTPASSAQRVPRPAPRTMGWRGSTTSLGQKDSLFGRYIMESAYQLVPYAYTQVPGYPEADYERNQYLTIEERHTFSPRFLNEVRFGYVRLFTQTRNPGSASNSGPLVQVAGRQAMDFIPGWGLTSLGPSPSSPSRPVVNRFSVGDDVIMSLGAHSLRFGATVTIPQLNQLWNQYSGGAWIFANLTGLFGPGLGGSLYGNALLCVCAAAPSYSYTTPGGTAYPFSDSAHWRQTWVDPYIQDDWKINKRLTLNIGLRYAWASNPTTVGQPIFVIPNLTATTTTECDFVTAHHPFTNNPNIKELRSAHWPCLGSLRRSQNVGPRRLRHVPRARHGAYLRPRQHVDAPERAVVLSVFQHWFSPTCLPVPTRS